MATSENTPHGDSASELRAERDFLVSEVEDLRRRLTDAPYDSRTIEQRLG